MARAVPFNKMNRENTRIWTNVIELVHFWDRGDNKIFNGSAALRMQMAMLRSVAGVLCRRLPHLLYLPGKSLPQTKDGHGTFPILPHPTALRRRRDGRARQCPRRRVRRGGRGRLRGRRARAQRRRRDRSGGRRRRVSHQHQPADRRHDRNYRPVQGRCHGRAHPRDQPPLPGERAQMLLPAADGRPVRLRRLRLHRRRGRHGHRQARSDRAGARCRHADHLEHGRGQQARPHCLRGGRHIQDERLPPG